MFKTALLTLVSTAVLSSALITPPQSADAAVAKLNAGQTLRATLSVQEVGGATTELTLLLAKPDRAKIESPAQLILTDGKTLTDLDKKANRYTTSEASEATLLAALNKPATFAYTAFFQSDPKKLFATSRNTGTRKLRNVDVSTIAVTLPNRDTADLYVESATGLVRGYSYVQQGKTWIVWATKIELTDQPADAQSFAFVAPAGAQDAKTMAPAADWAAVSKIFAASCMPCHGQNARAGLDLRSHATASKHRSVTPGNAASSALVRSIKGQGKAMPPTGPRLSPENIAQIETWINEGAKE